jgi:hypothetical protein
LAADQRLKRLERLKRRDRIAALTAPRKRAEQPAQKRIDQDELVRPSRRREKAEAKNTPDEERQSSERARVCKERPDPVKAARSGSAGKGRKKFVPWCG